MLNWNQKDKSNNCAQTIKDDEDENERDWKGEAKEANRRLQEKKEEVSESLLKVSCLKSLFFQVAELKVIKEQLKEKQGMLESDMEASRKEKEAQAEEVTPTLCLLQIVYQVHLIISVCLLENQTG